LPGVHQHPPERRHSIADVLALVDRLRRLAYDLTLEADDALRRIRDAFADYTAPDRPNGRPHFVHSPDRQPAPCEHPYL